MTTRPSTSRDVHVTTAKLDRTSVIDLPLNYLLTCAPSTGWVLWRRDSNDSLGDYLLAGEYCDWGLRVDVGGVVIVDSLTTLPLPEEEE